MKKLHIVAVFSMVAVLSAAPSSMLHAGQIRGHASALDGDTLQIGALRIRLHGIDAPEYSQTCRSPSGSTGWPCGIQARDELEVLIDEQEITCTARARDWFGRIVATCFAADGTDLAEALVLQGLAWAYVKYSAAYAGVEQEARRAGTGIWRAATMAAWEYRELAREWEEAAGAVASSERASDQGVEPPRPGCEIKGNVTTAGERIYHTPKSRYYARTRISPSQGEAWFCSAEEAEAAGWRPAG